MVLYNCIAKRQDKIMKKYRILGFTLAETLITLVIIGVVAAITLPVLFSNYQEEQTKAALKKNYAAFKNAFYKLKYIDGADYNNLVIPANNQQINVTTSFKNDLSKYMVISKFCRHTEGCFPSVIYKKNGKVYTSNYSSTTDQYSQENISFVLNDGTSVLLTLWSDFTITGNYMGINGNRLESVALVIFIDVNGLRKPNTNGKDIFYFVLGKDGIIPTGIDDKGAYCDNLNTNNLDCAIKILGK